MFRTMKTNLKNAIVPHEGNDYKPHLLRRTGVLVVLVISALVFLFGYLERSLLFSDRMLATIYPTLVASLSNENREDAKLPALNYSPLLEEAARLKAEDMKIRGYFAHVSPDGIDPWHWFKKVGYDYEYAGENLAINFSDSADVTKAWMDSPGHRQNILSSNFTEIGVATVKGYIDGKKTVFVVQMFGSPSKDMIANQTPLVPETATPAPAVAVPEELSVEGEEQTVLGLTTSKPIDETITAAGVFTALSFLISNPRTIMFSIYWVLGLAVLLSITLLLVFFKHRHVPHILYGFCILLWIIASALLYVYFFGPRVIVAN